MDYVGGYCMVLDLTGGNLGRAHGLSDAFWARF